MFKTISSNRKLNRKSFAGLTMIELMIVIAILVAVTAIAIPVVRIVNRDRKIREGAREVNGMLARARDDALITGRSGIEFVRNIRYVDGNGVNFASTSMYLLKFPPPYSGDSVSSRVETIAHINATTFDVSVPAPASPTVLINIDDEIQLDYRGPRYRIVAITPGATMVLRCQIPVDPISGAPQHPLPPIISSANPQQRVAFKIFRRPVRKESTRVELPAGLFIDLRLSGHLDLGDADANAATATTFGLAGVTGGATPQQFSVIVMFDGTGSIDRVYPNGLTSNGLTSGTTGIFPYYIPADPLYMLVVADPTGESPVVDNLANTDNLWLKTDNKSGQTSTSPVSELGSADTVTISRIRKSRGIASQGQTANQ